MSIKRLKTLIAVAEEGTFAAAAEVVHLSQAAVSVQMKSMEEDFNLELFDRAKRPPELTLAGKALVPKARELVCSYDNLIPSITGEKLFAGELVMGAVPTCLSGLIPKALVRLRKTFPELRIKIVPGLSGDLLLQLERGFLDVAVCTEPVKRQNHLIWHHLANEPLFVLAPPQAVGDDPINLLQTSPFIRFNRQAWVGWQINEWITRKNIRVKDAMELDSLEAISTMVYNNLGVSIVPLRCVPGPSQLPLRRLSLGDSIKPRSLGLLSMHNSPKESLIQATYKTFSRLIEGEKAHQTSSSDF